MDTSRIESQLERAVYEAARIIDKLHDPTTVSHAATNNEGLSAARVSLVQSLSDEPELSIFNEKVVPLPHGAFKVTHEALADWLIWRSVANDVKTALNDLTKYLDETDFEYTVMAGLVGVKVKGSTDLANNITLASASRLMSRMSSTLTGRIEPDVVEMQVHVNPTAVLSRPHPQRKRHVTPDGEVNYFWPTSVAEGCDTDISDAILCLTLIGPSAPVLVGVWRVPDDSVPLPPKAHGWQTDQAEFGRIPIRDLSVDDLTRLQELFHIFVNLAESQKQWLRVPLKRLNSAIRRHDTVDAAIDLGIAMESVFLHKDSEGEFTYKLKVRAARLLGTNPTERKHFFELAGQLYRLRSKAVHTGAISDPGAEEVLKDGFAFVASAIETMMKNPSTDWLDLIAG